MLRYVPNRNQSTCCDSREALLTLGSTIFLHGVCMLRECIYGECAHEQHLRRTLTLTLTLTPTHTITAYSVNGNFVRMLHTHLCIIIIIIHEFHRDASLETKLQGR